MSSAPNHPSAAPWREASQSQPARQGGPAPGPGLHIVATPIGNARDITLRALDVLAAADIVACEDTRLSGRFLARHGIKAKLLAYHDHNAERVRPGLIRRLKKGEIVALISDAGTPLISDPGYKLVAAARAEGLAVHAVPGPSAAVAALSVAGLPTDRFLFVGFPPAKAKARETFLADLAGIEASLVFYESPRRLAASLAAMAAILGPRPAAVARELTKLHEEVRQGRLDELAAAVAEAGVIKGEIVVIVAPPVGRPAYDDDTLDQALRAALATAPLRDAVDAVAGASGRKRREVYARALELSGRR